MDINDFDWDAIAGWSIILLYVCCLIRFRYVRYATYFMFTSTFLYFAVESYIQPEYKNDDYITIKKQYGYTCARVNGTIGFKSDVPYDWGCFPNYLVKK